MNEIEQDLWDDWLSAGACWRAAKVDIARAEFWLEQAQAHSDRAATLLRWDVAGWRRTPEVQKPGR